MKYVVEPVAKRTVWDYINGSKKSFAAMTRNANEDPWCFLYFDGNLYTSVLTGEIPPIAIPGTSPFDTLADVPFIAPDDGPSYNVEKYDLETHRVKAAERLQILLNGGQFFIRMFPQEGQSTKS